MWRGDLHIIDEDDLEDDKLLKELGCCVFVPFRVVWLESGCRLVWLFSIATTRVSLKA